MSRAVAPMEAAPSPLAPLRGWGVGDKIEVGVRLPIRGVGAAQGRHSTVVGERLAYLTVPSSWWATRPRETGMLCSFHGYLLYMPHLSCPALGAGDTGEGNTSSPTYQIKRGRGGNRNEMGCHLDRGVRQTSEGAQQGELCEKCREGHSRQGEQHG